MPKLRQLQTFEQVLAEDLRDPAFRVAWDRTAVARALSHCIIRYRVDHGLTQSQLVRHLGMTQSTIARLELGEHEPTLRTLTRLARGLGISFRVDITPDAEPALSL